MSSSLTLPQCVVDYVMLALQVYFLRTIDPFSVSQHYPIFTFFDSFKQINTSLDTGRLDTLNSQFLNVLSDLQPLSGMK